MTREELYHKLRVAFDDYRRYNLLQSSYLNRVLRIVKKYLQYDELKEIVKELKEVVDAQEILIEHLKIQREQLKQALGLKEIAESLKEFTPVTKKLAKFVEEKEEW